MRIFQFHKGTIRTDKENQEFQTRLNFNSIKVQLEQRLNYALFHISVFQFHKGTIRTQGLMIYRHHVYHFNSIKVQLEPNNRTTCYARLALFQFHKGTIRTQNNHEKISIQNTDFNSIKVQLELSVASRHGITLVFQFHKGTIRTSYTSFRCFRL